MSKFKVGDEVEVVSLYQSEASDYEVGETLKVSLINDSFMGKILFFEGKGDVGLYEDEVKLFEPKQTHKDNINPSHYTQGKYETIDIILDRVKDLPGDQATLVGNIIKYLWRYDKKNGVECLKKSEWYLDKLIEVVEDEPSNK